VKCVFAWPELQSERLVDGQSQDTQRDVKGAKDDRRPRDPNLVSVPTQHADDQQRDAPREVQHVVADVRGIDWHRHTQPVDEQEEGAVQQQAHPQDPDVDADQPHRIQQAELRAQQAHARAAA
jgi:hypothetical protein